MQLKDTGGPAFPCDWIDNNSIGEQVVREQYQGMTLWDYFAAHAPNKPKNYGDVGKFAHLNSQKNEAKWRADYADAMIIERKKRFGGKNE